MFKLSAKKDLVSLGVDIGTKVIRIVELSRKKDKISLENYGEVNLDIASKDFFRSFDKKSLNPSVENISNAVKMIVEETGIKPNEVVFSLPDFATFFTTFELPPMSKKEITGAIGFEARKYIPLPLSELVLDWQTMSDNPEKERSKVLVMAVQNSIVEQYKGIAEGTGLILTALEAETMAFKRAVCKKGDPITCLLEIGFHSTNVSIVDNDFMVTSFSFDMAGKDLTFSLSETLNITTEQAEEMKKREGLNGSISHILTPLLSIISEKVRKVIREYEVKEGKKVQKVIVAGGTSIMPGIIDYFKKSLSQEESQEIDVVIAEPLKNISYPPILEEKMKEVGPTYAIAIGEALRKFE
jgi:type IV pilus assembly protein PilM